MTNANVGSREDLDSAPTRYNRSAMILILYWYSNGPIGSKEQLIGAIGGQFFRQLSVDWGCLKMGTGFLNGRQQLTLPSL